jgi:hypothetical protein
MRKAKGEGSTGGGRTLFLANLQVKIIQNRKKKAAGALPGKHKAANEHLGLVERAESGSPGACARPLKWPVGSLAGGGLFPCVDRQTAPFDTH